MFDMLSAMLTDQYFKAVNTAAKEKYKPTQHPSIRGRYVVLKKINHRNPGDVVCSSEGLIHGILDNQRTPMTVVKFTNREYFKPHVPVDMSEIELLLTTLK